MVVVVVRMAAAPLVLLLGYLLEGSCSHGSSRRMAAAPPCTLADWLPPSPFDTVQRFHEAERVSVLGGLAEACPSVSPELEGFRNAPSLLVGAPKTPVRLTAKAASRVR
jgi:hypothetical protein